MAVVGGGVLGLCVGAELQRRGRRLCLLDPGDPSASSVAAGMIAPALESAIEDVNAARAALMRQGRAAWEAFAPAFGLELRRAPALWRGDPAMQARLERLGFETHRLGSDISIPLDVQIDPVAALDRLRALLASALLTGRVLTVEQADGGWRVRGEGFDIQADRLVIATGAAPALPGLPDAVADLIGKIQPIRGQIGWSPTRLASTVVRGPGGYVAPTRTGVLIGATMEMGRRDLEPDARAGSALVEMAEGLLGAEIAGVEWRVGVRGASPDGLPLAGFSGVANLHLALAPRRNGWLFGPLVANLVAESLEGRSSSPAGAAFAPGRFG